ncbi:hypothetical protein H0A36_01735 [Endozoicomonas sp. SM1973]|uniref:Uncharacterized protein n=1 Tax=Spartinivicinus marinus TaxID=2994442 RepID=A0A853I1U6_9GAMM|nr:hypothetical protein [Spartinivicinus marinus]MCX4030047.1 hypothetical protein [Spartinivicinus marinus]NYZ64708.1 hypothetical protein [Spartinivicinus marinus]
MSKRYELVFHGELIAGFTEAAAKQNVAKLFKANEQQIAIFFSGKRVVIKNQLDQATGEKYLQALKKAGLNCQLTEMGAAESTVSSQPTSSANQPPPTQQPPAKPAEPSNQEASQTESNEASTDAPEWSIAPTGSLMKEQSNTAPPPPPDTSKLSIAPMKGYIVEPSKKTPPPAPDTSHLSVKPEEKKE